MLVLTDGSKGSWEPDQDLAALVATRREEQRDAARALGALDVHFLDAVDGELEDDAARREQVCAVIRATRPDVVLGHDPWKQYRLHPDHRRAGQLAIDGIVAARDPHFFPGAGTPHRPSRLLLFEAQVVDHVEAVDALDVDSQDRSPPLPPQPMALDHGHRRRFPLVPRPKGGLRRTHSQRDRHHRRRGLQAADRAVTRRRGPGGPLRNVRWC